MPSSCLARFFAHEASSADHPVGLLFTTTTTSAAEPPRCSRSVDTSEDLHATAESHVLLSSVFLDVFTALHVVFGYLTLTLWNYLGTHRDMVLARYAEGTGRCYAPCTSLSSARGDTASLVTEVDDGDTALCVVVNAGCDSVPGALAAAYLGVVCAGLMFAVGLTIFTVGLNSPCVVSWWERRWVAAHTHVHALTPLVSLSVPQYSFVGPMYVQAVDDMVSTGVRRTAPAMRRRDAGEGHEHVHRAVETESGSDDDTTTHQAASAWYTVFCLPDSKAVLLWLFSPIVLVLVVLDGFLLTWSTGHPRFSRLDNAFTLDSAVSASDERKGTVTVLHAAVLALGIALFLYTVRVVVWHALRGCFRAIFRACLRCVLALDERVDA